MAGLAIQCRGGGCISNVMVCASTRPAATSDAADMAQAGLPFIFWHTKYLLICDAFIDNFECSGLANVGVERFEPGVFAGGPL